MFNTKLKQKIQRLNNAIGELHMHTKELETERDKYLKRARELEDAFKKEQGIAVRQDITKIIVNFNKVEMAIMLAAISKLISTEGTKVDEVEYMVGLLNKIKGFIADMDEPKELKEDKR